MTLLPTSPRIRRVNSFQELLTTPFADGVNALCWPRVLAGDFGEVVAALDAREAIEVLDEDRLLSLRVSAAGRMAIDTLLADLRLLRDADLDPALNVITGYPPDDAAAVVRTDVFSFHADLAPIPAATWLCTYHGAPSEGLLNEEALKRIDDPTTRAALLREYGGDDDEAFREFLSENCYDLHYAPLPGARPYSFGVGNLWRIACEWPGSPVPPCVHRAPDTVPGEPRLMMIS